MSTLEEIQQQIAELQAKANELIHQKKAEVLEQVRANIRTFGLTAEECGFTINTPAKPVKPTTTATAKPKPEAKYRGPNGEEWAGGRGAKPKWVKEIMDSGGNIDDYLINKEEAI